MGPGVEKISAQRVVLVVIDGWGLGPAGAGNAIWRATTPVMDALWSEWPHTELDASGIAVGLPKGQMGNSEVGHLTIGAGRVVMQALPRISAAVEAGLGDHPVIAPAIERAVARGATVHIVGMVSPGGVHSHIDHIVALARVAVAKGAHVQLHAITDGRDEAPGLCPERLDTLVRAVGKECRLATLSGRYFAMDRDNRWERTGRYVDCLLKGEAPLVPDAVAFAQEQIAAGVTDEFLPPVRIGEESAPLPAHDDLFIMANFRPDRMRQITHVLADPTFDRCERGLAAPFEVVTATSYDASLHVAVAFPSETVDDGLCQAVAHAHGTQYHVAETEKYAHVTYFVNGGKEDLLSGEERLLIASPTVATYDLQPTMSAGLIAQAVCARLAEQADALIVVNFANPDMVGHTGVVEATITACEEVDRCMGEIWEMAQKVGVVLVVTADHGNAEEMVSSQGKPVTAHTTNKVPLIVAGGEKSLALRDGGGLRDVAPTLLALLGYEAPAGMTGANLATYSRAAQSV